MKKKIFKSIPIGLGVLAFASSFFTYGASGLRFPGEDYEHRRLISFIFGGGKLYSADKNQGTIQIDPFCGISIFGVLSFVCLLVAGVFFILYCAKKQEKLYVLSSAFLVLSGVVILLLLTVGTFVGASPYFGVEYSTAFRYYELGSGTVIWSLLCVLGGTFGFYLYFFEK
ncbi:MAG: hypothetical protein E7364_04155 [Clostridiales bacterium]|nr:hypothetical protein [Clostridiales bacterium]